MKKYQKLIFLFGLFILLAAFGWSQQPARNMVYQALINKIETQIGDLSTTQENQFINAWDKYVADSRNANPSEKQQAITNYQTELKEILTPQKYAILNQSPEMKSLPGFGIAASQN